MGEPVNNELALAVETSGTTGSIAVGTGDKILGETTFSGIMTHSKELLPAAETLLKHIDRHISDLAHIYIAAGPGSFTGVRFLDEAYWPAHARAVYSVCRKKTKAGDFADPTTLVPYYLRQPEATENWDKLHKTQK